MAVLYLSVDCGGSQTKIIYQHSGSTSPQYLLMSPLVEEIKPEKLDIYLERKSSLGSPAPEREAYLKWNNRVFIVGDLATEFDPEDRTSEQKYENALYKVAAAIGVIVDKSKLKLGKQKLEINLGVLIPWNEYNDRSIFEQRLTTMLASFEFRSQKIAGQLANILIRPEGGGIAATYIRQQGTDWLHQHQLAVLMFGHRNVTALYFDGGKLSGDSPLFGFTNFLDGVIERKSLERERLALAVMDTIAQAYEDTHPQDSSYNKYPDWAKYRPIQNLAQAKDAELNQQEVKLIEKAIAAARAEYWEKIQKWLSKTLPQELDVVILNGGAAQFLEPDLEKYFNAAHAVKKKDLYWNSWVRTGNYMPQDEDEPMPEILWANKMIELIRSKFAIAENKDPHNVAIRLADCYGLFDYLIATMEKVNDKKAA